MAHVGNRFVLLEKNGLSDSGRCILKVCIKVRKLPNSISADMRIELPMIVTELGLPHIIRSDNGPCYNAKEFQQFFVTASHTKPAGQTIQDLMDLLREWSELPRS